MDIKKFRLITKFTIVQQVKGKAFKVSTCIILAAVLILSSLTNIIPAISSRKSGGDSGTDSAAANVSVEKIYVLNDSDMKINLDEPVRQINDNIQVLTGSKSKDEYIRELESTKENEMLIHITEGDGGYNVEAITPKENDLSDDADIILNVATAYIKNNILLSCGVSEENLAKVQMPVNSSMITAGEKESDGGFSIVDFLFPMIACILLFYIIYFYGYWVANSIVAEKTSRVMELLLTSTRPIELVVGKCVGMGTLAMIQFLSIIIMAFLGNWIGGIIGVNVISSSYKAFNLIGMLSDISAGKIILVVIFFILGYTLYAVFNALVGATVSKLEDLNAAIMPVSFVSIISFYISYMALFSGGVIAKVATYLPFSSPFYIPSVILSDTVSYGQMAVSLIILIVFIILFVLFTARVYSVVILQTGNRIKIKDLFAIYKNEK